MDNIMYVAIVADRYTGMTRNVTIYSDSVKTARERIEEMYIDKRSEDVITIYPEAYN